MKTCTFDEVGIKVEIRSQMLIYWEITLPRPLNKTTARDIQRKCCVVVHDNRRVICGSLDHAGGNPDVLVKNGIVSQEVASYIHNLVDESKEAVRKSEAKLI